MRGCRLATMIQGDAGHRDCDGDIETETVRIGVGFPDWTGMGLQVPPLPRHRHLQLALGSAVGIWMGYGNIKHR